MVGQFVGRAFRGWAHVLLGHFFLPAYIGVVLAASLSDAGFSMPQKQPEFREYWVWLWLVNMLCGYIWLWLVGYLQTTLWSVAPYLASADWAPEARAVVETHATLFSFGDVVTVRESCLLLLTVSTVQTVLVWTLVYVPLCALGAVSSGIFPVVFFRVYHERVNVEGRLSLPVEFLCLHILFPQAVRTLRVMESADSAVRWTLLALLRSTRADAAERFRVRWWLFCAAFACVSGAALCAATVPLVVGRRAVRLLDPSYNTDLLPLCFGSSVLGLVGVLVRRGARCARALRAAGVRQLLARGREAGGWTARGVVGIVAWAAMLLVFGFLVPLVVGSAVHEFVMLPTRYSLVSIPLFYYFHSWGTGLLVLKVASRMLRFQSAGLERPQEVLDVDAALAALQADPICLANHWRIYVLAWPFVAVVLEQLLVPAALTHTAVLVSGSAWSRSAVLVQRAGFHVYFAVHASARMRGTLTELGRRAYARLFDRLYLVSTRLQNRPELDARRAAT